MDKTHSGHGNKYAALDDLNHLIYLLKSRGGLSLIEKDLALEKLRYLYDQISRMETITTAVPQKEPDIPAAAFVESAKVTVTETKEETKEEEFIVTEKKASPVIAEEAKPLTEETPQKEDMPVEKQIGKILSDKYQGGKKLISEQLSEDHPSHDISVKLRNKPIDDLSKAIGLNDKFLFINELFHGDSSKYKNTLETINSAPDFNGAFTYITDHFNWDMKNETVQKLLELIRRKFISMDK